MFKFILSLILTSSLTWGSQYGSPQERQIIDVIHAIRQLQETETGDAGRLDDFLASLGASPAPFQEELDRALAQNILGQSALGILEGLERWYATTIDRPSVYYREGATVYVPRSGPRSGHWGHILTIDEREGMATVELDRWGRNTQETLLLRELAVASGCLKEGELCIGQRVYTTSGKWNQRTIEAIDYYGNRVVVKRRGISIVSPDELLLRHGCLEGTRGENFCVGDSFPMQGQGEKYPSRARIVAVGKSTLLVQYYSFEKNSEGDRIQKQKREFLRPNQLDRMILSHGHH